MDLDKLSELEKWAELGKQYVLIEQVQNNIRLLKESLAKKEENGKDEQDTPVA